MSPKPVANKQSQSIKLVLCLCLGGGLIIALAFPPSDSNGSAPTDNTSVSLAVRPSLNTAATETSHLRTFKKRDIDEIRSRNPFASLEPVVKVLEEVPLVEEPPMPVPVLTAVYGRQSAEAAALMGSTVVRAGDVLNDGRAVQRIERRAVIAE